jgi:hypothetical protein
MQPIAGDLENNEPVEVRQRWLTEEWHKQRPKQSKERKSDTDKFQG